MGEGTNGRSIGRSGSQGLARLASGVAMAAAVGVAGCSDDSDPVEPGPGESVVVEGTVADDQTGDAIANASVTGEDAATGDDLFSTTTGADGTYEAEFEVADDPAEVRVEAVAEGYEAAEVTVGFDDTMTADLDLTPEPQPDVVVEEASAEPSSADIGETVTVTAHVQNHGTAAGEKTLTLYLDGDAEDEKTVSVDAPGAGEGPEDTEVEAEFTWSTYDPGDYELSVNEVEAGTVAMDSANELEGYEWAQEVVDVSAGSYERFGTPCPNDKVALAGGVRVVGAAGEETATRIHMTAPGALGPDEFVTWVLGISNRSTSEKSVEARTVCADPPDGFDVHTNSVELEAGDFEEFRATCPAGQVVLSGGMLVPGWMEGSDTRVQYSKPVSTDDGDEWRVGVLNTGDSEEEMLVRAVCSEPVPGYTRVADDFELPGADYERVFARCGEDQKVLGGGVSVLDQDGGEPDTRVRSDFPGTTGGGATYQWLTGISNESADDLQVRSHAICADY